MKYLYVAAGLFFTLSAENDNQRVLGAAVLTASLSAVLKEA